MKQLKLGLFVTNTERDYNKARASFWIRIFQMIEYYESLGVNVSVNNYFKRYDAVILFRKVKPKYYRILKYLKLISKTAYFDTCINIFSNHEEINDDKLVIAHKIGHTADGLICASHQIAKHALPYCNSVFVMEDPVNLIHFPQVKTDINFDNPMFGWSGVGLKSIFLNPYADIINNRICIVADNETKKVGLKFNYEFHLWRYETIQQDLLRCDIAFLPRSTGDKYNDSHSSFKALVYAVTGIPIIANKIPSYVDMAKYYDGIVFLEDHNNEVNNCIKELRKRSMDTSGVREHYSCQYQAALLIRYLVSQLEEQKRKS